jgi:tetratricopeptide (TPR) repeat protein
MVIGIILLLLAVAAVLGWQIHRRAQARTTAAAGQVGAADEREATLLRAVQAHPSQSKAHRELADYYLGHQRPFEALWELAMVHDLGLVDVALTHDTAEVLKRAGLPQAARRVLSAAHEDFHREPSLDRALARIDLEVADPQAAAQVTQSNPMLRAGPDGLLLLARAHLALDDLPAARADWRRARQAIRSEHAPNRAEWSLALGRLALALGDLSSAREELAAAVRANPGDEETQYDAGLAFAGSGSAAGTTRAIEAFKQATQDDPRKARAGVELGRLLYEKPGQWERAAEVYRRALSMDVRCLTAEEGLARVRTALKQPGEAVYHQARICELKDRPDEALRLYRRWGELRPERWDSVLRAAECWMDMGRFLDAVHEVRRGLERYPDNPELFSHLAQLYLRTDSRPEAARLCDRWSRLDPTSGRPEWVRGQLAEKALRNDEAIRWYEAAVRKDPRFGTYHAALGAALASQPAPERLRRARAELEQAIALDPPMASFQSQLGLVLQQLGDLEGARRAFLRALDRDSDRLDAYAGLMEVARRLGQPRVAAFFAGLERDARDRQRVETAARQDLSIHPRDARAQEVLAQALLRRGELAEARNHLEIAAEQPGGAAARPLLRRVGRLLDVL